MLGSLGATARRGDKTRRRQYDFWVQFNCLLFGFGSWITIIGFWAEVPVLIERLPEGWALQSYLNVFIQAANIGPVVYFFCRKYKLCTEVTANHIQLLIGALCCVLLMSSWDYTVHFYGQQRSIVLFLAAFGLSLTDCTSSVTFLPFMARFREVYLTPYLIGEGLSGFIPIIVASIQGVDTTGGEDSPCSVHDSNSSSRNSAAASTTASAAAASSSVSSLAVSLSTTLPLSSPATTPLRNTTATNPWPGWDQNATASSFSSFSPSSFFFTESNNNQSSVYVAQPSLVLTPPPPTSTSIQGTQILFSPNVFFASLLVTLFIAWAAFVYLLASPKARKEQIYYTRKETLKPATKSSGDNGKDPEVKETEQETKFNFNESGGGGHVKDEARAEDFGPRVRLTRKEQYQYNYLQGLIVFACLSTFGLMPSIQSYSTLPYGKWTLHYVVILGGLAYPLGCFVAMLAETTSIRLINLLTALGTFVSIYLVVCALMSPHPPFLGVHLDTKSLEFEQRQLLGGTISVACWVLAIGILSYVKTVVTVLLNRAKGEEALFWVGMFTQIGSLFGAIIMYLAVNHTSWFSGDSQCQQSA